MEHQIVTPIKATKAAVGPRHKLYDATGRHIGTANSKADAAAAMRACNAHGDLVKAGAEIHAALFDLAKAYAAVQEHYGLKPEASPTYVAAVNASTRMAIALSKAGAA